MLAVQVWVGRDWCRLPCGERKPMRFRSHSLSRTEQILLRVLLPPSLAQSIPPPNKTERLRLERLPRHLLVKASTEADQRMRLLIESLRSEGDKRA